MGLIFGQQLRRGATVAQKTESASTSLMQASRPLINTVLIEENNDAT
jgi:hypothetical protein